MRVRQEVKDRLERREPVDRPGKPEILVTLERREIKDQPDPLALLDRPDFLDQQGHLVIKASRARMGNRALQEIAATQVPMDHPVLPEPLEQLDQLAIPERPVFPELRVTTELRVHQEVRVHLDSKDHKDLLDSRVLPDQLAYRE